MMGSISRLRQAVVRGTRGGETPGRVQQGIWVDILITVAMAAAGGVGSFYGASSIDLPIDFGGSTNVWFSSDVNRVYGCMNNPEHVYHYRAKVHPLFALVAYPPVKILRDGFSISPVLAVKILISAVVMLSMGTMYALLRLIGCPRPDGMLFSILAATSAWGMFWNVVPETYPFGTLSILLALAFVAAAENRRFSFASYVVASTLTLSITISNWMLGIIMAFVKLPWRKAFSVTVYAFAAASFLFGVQKYFMPEAIYFLGDREEEMYIFHPESESGMCRARTFLFHSMVMPGIEEKENPQNVNCPTMTVQRSALGSGGRWGLGATLLWPVVLGAGIVGMASVSHQRHFRIVLASTLIFQFVLHMVYGDETFLYSGHFGPLLVIVAAFGTMTKARPVLLILTAAFVVSSAVNNGIQFRRAGNQFELHDAPRQAALSGSSHERFTEWPCRARDAGGMKANVENGVSELRDAGVAGIGPDRNHHLKRTHDRRDIIPVAFEPLRQAGRCVNAPL